VGKGKNRGSSHEDARSILEETYAERGLGGGRCVFYQEVHTSTQKTDFTNIKGHEILQGVAGCGRKLWGKKKTGVSRRALPEKGGVKNGDRKPKDNSDP